MLATNGTASENQIAWDRESHALTGNIFLVQLASHPSIEINYTLHETYMLGAYCVL